MKLSILICSIMLVAGILSVSACNHGRGRCRRHCNNEIEFHARNYDRGCDNGRRCCVPKNNNGYGYGNGHGHGDNKEKPGSGSGPEAAAGPASAEGPDEAGPRGAGRPKDDKGGPKDDKGGPKGDKGGPEDSKA